MSGRLWFEDVIQDVRFGLRTFRRSPGFTAVAVLTLAVAIGANTAIFSLIDPLLYRDLAVSEPGRLVQFRWRYPGDPPLNLFSFDSVEQYRARATVFAGIAGLAPLVSEAAADGQRITAHVVTGNFFQLLGVRPALGRVLDGADDAAGAATVAVVNWQTWTNRFNSNPRILGSAFDIRDPRLPAPVHATIVGVAARGFDGVTVGAQPDVWISMSAIPPNARARAALALIARLKPGATLQQARAEMLVLDRPRIEALAQRDPQWRQVQVDVSPARAGLATPLHDQFGEALRLLLAIAGAVLLLACANLGGILLARGATRQREMALRVSIGAGRSRIFRQMLVESSLLAAAGAMAGFIGARPAAAVLVRIITSGTRSLAAPPRLEIALDMRVLAFTVAIAALAALAFGAVPAVAAFNSAPARALRSGGTPPPSRRAFSSALVIAQVAISLTLVSVAQLYADHLRHLRDRSLGFDRNGVLLVSVDTSHGDRSREQLFALYKTAKTRLLAVSGVRSVAASGMTPISGAAGSRFLRVDGFDEPAQERRRVALNTISDEYFTTYGTPLVAGRDFRDADLAQRRVIVNQALARRYFAGRDPIGRHVWLENEKDPYDIVGVAGDAKYQDVHIAAPPIVYLFAPMSRGVNALSLRTDIPPTWVAPDAGRVIADVFGAGSVRRVTTLAEQIDASIVPERLMAALSGFFGIAGAILAAVGLYGLLAYTVARRTREIGVRVALGATRSAVVRLVLVRAFWLVVGGLLLGAPVALWADHFAARRLVNVPSTGMLPMVVAAVAMMAVGLLAAYVPAWRATRVEPVIALRAE